jgi:hypothetical protein
MRTCRLTPLYSTPRAAIVAALLAVAPGAAIADQSTTTTTDLRIAIVSLADLNLSSPDGKCARPAPACRQWLSASSAACVHDTLAGALAQGQRP